MKKKKIVKKKNMKNLNVKNVLKQIYFIEYNKIQISKKNFNFFNFLNKVQN